MVNPLAYLREVVGISFPETEDFSELFEEDPHELTGDSRLRLQDQLKRILSKCGEGELRFPTPSYDLACRLVQSDDPKDTTLGYVGENIGTNSGDVVMAYVSSFLELLQGEEPFFGGRLFRNPNDSLTVYHLIRDI